MARNINILVVEDEPNDALLINVALHKTLPGVHIAVVPNGIEAVEYLNGSGPYSDRSVYPCPDFVLLDLKLPLMDGFEVLRWIRGQPELKLLPVIALTGSLRNEDARLACEAGANLCVLKSGGFNKLAETMLQAGGATSHGIDVATTLGPAQQDASSKTPQEVGGGSISEPPDATMIQPAPGGDHPDSGARHPAHK